MIQVIDRALLILEFVSQSDMPVRLPEIAQATGLEVSTCANIVSSLAENDLLRRDGEKRKFSYSIGQKIHQLSGKNITAEFVKHVAAIEMDNLAKDIGASCILAVVEQQTRVIIHESKPNTRLQVFHHKTYPAYASSMGRFILAHYDNKNLKQFITQFGLPSTDAWKGVLDLKTMNNEFLTIRSHVLEPKLVKEDEVVMMFAPIHYYGKIIAALGLYLPISSYDKNTFSAKKVKFKRLLDLIDNQMKG